MKINQQGIAHLVLLLFLLAAVGMGTYLVQQRTNILPFAQEDNNQCPDLSQYCEDGQTRQCTGGYPDEEGTCQRSCGIIEGNPLSCGGSEVTTESDTETNNENACSDQRYYCDPNVDQNTDPSGRTSKRIYKTGGYFTDDPSDPLYGERVKDSSAPDYGCVYHFQDTEQPCDGTEETLGTPLLKTQGGEAKTCPDEGLIYCDQDQETLQKFKVRKHNAQWNAEKNECEYDFERITEGDECAEKGVGDVIQAGSEKEVAAGEGAPLSEKTLACSEEQVIKPYVDSKLEANLIYYYAIITGTSNRCVKADLTLPEFIRKDGIDGGTGRRLYLCSGNDGTIKWRVQASDGSNNLVQTKEQFPTDPNDPDFPGYHHVREAESKSGISL